MDLTIPLSIALILCISILVWVVLKPKKSITQFVLDHDQYQKVLEFFLEKAYALIYKDRIFIYSLDGQKPTDEDYKKASIDFAKLSLKLMGPTLTQEYINLYGTLDTLLLNISEFFTNKTEHDEIYQESMDQLMDQEE